MTHSRTPVSRTVCAVILATYAFGCAPAIEGARGKDQKARTETGQLPPGSQRDPQIEAAKLQLKSEDRDKRVEAAEWIRQYAKKGNDATKAVPDLMKALLAALDNSERLDIVRALRFASQNTGDVLRYERELLDLMNRTEYSLLRNGVAQILACAYMNDKKWDSLQKLLKHDDPRVREIALYQMTSLQSGLATEQNVE